MLRSCQDESKSSRSPSIQLFTLRDFLGMYQTGAYDTVKCNDSVKGTGKI